jgi:hypothetical protein
MDSSAKERTKRKKRKKAQQKTPNTEISSNQPCRQVTQTPNAPLHLRPAKKQRTTSISVNNPPIHPFEVDDSDHCETSLDAYKDVVLLLDFIAKSLGKRREILSIYDPYYCNGGVKDKLASLGFTNVINENKDFYKNDKEGTIPHHDVLLTNPPYSGIHMEKLLTFGAKNRKPFLLLLPHFVYTKDYYERGLGDMAKQVFYLVPPKRYSYVPPSWVSSTTGSTALAKGKPTTAPFPTFWYCRIPSMNDSWLTKAIGPSGKYNVHQKLHYANCTAHLPREVKGEFDVTKKRPNPKARKRSAAKKRVPGHVGM